MGILTVSLGSVKVFLKVIRWQGYPVYPHPPYPVIKLVV